MNLFGKKKQAPPPNPAEAIMKLRGTMETLTKREAYIQKKIELMVSEAKQKMARKDKNGALFALKKKKMYEVRNVSRRSGSTPNATPRHAMPYHACCLRLSCRFGGLLLTPLSPIPHVIPVVVVVVVGRLGWQAEITKIQGAMMNLESQAMSLEGSATNMEVFGAMRTGAKAMGAMRGAMCVLRLFVCRVCVVVGC